MGLQFIPRAATAASFVVLTTAASTLTGAQAVLRGILYDDATGARVRGTVMLVDPATDAAVVHVATDSLGQFSIEMPSGKYQIAAVRPGYTSVLSAPVQFANGER